MQSLSSSLFPTACFLFLLLAGCAPTRPSAAGGIRDATGAQCSDVDAEPQAATDSQRVFSADFESTQGWDLRGATADTAVKRSGKASVSMRQGAGEFARVGRALDASQLRGRRIHIRAWLKSKDVSGGWVGLFVYVARDKQRLFSDNMQGRGLTGTTDWTQAEIAADIPWDATSVTVGALSAGEGEGWIDDLEVVSSLFGAPIELKGRVTDKQGKPVGGAWITAARSMRRDAVVLARTNAKGDYSLEVPIGNYGLTVTAPRHFAVQRTKQELVSDRRIDFQLAGDEGLHLQGKVTSELGAGAELDCVRASWELAIYHIHTDSDGSYNLTLPRGDYACSATQGDARSEIAFIAEQPSAVRDFKVVAKQPVPDAVVDWLRESAVPLRTWRTGHGFSDMKPLAKLVKGAEVVALGEATHGSQEFYQAKGRLLEYLVAEHGFSVLTFEANWPESEALEHYVLTGQGDPRTALKRLKYFMWETEEALEVVEWMRAWNAKHPRKVRLIGVDVYLTEGSAARVVQFLSQVDAELLASKRKLLSRLQSQPFEQEDLDVEATLTALGEITSRLDERRAAYVGASSERAWGEARHAADLLVWAYQARKDPTARERGMASSVDWALAQAGPNAKAVYWAHNAHIERVSALTKRTGNFLAERKGARYRAIGALFGGGSFRAGDWTGSRSHDERTFSIGPPPLGSIESAFTRAGWPLAVVDLRKPAGTAAQRDAATAWLAHPQTMREIGGAFVSEEAMQDDVLLGQRFDGVYFVQTTREATVLK